jgi:hypothetical protein
MSGVCGVPRVAGSTSAGGSASGGWRHRCRAPIGFGFRHGFRWSYSGAPPEVCSRLTVCASVTFPRSAAPVVIRHASTLIVVQLQGRTGAYRATPMPARIQNPPLVHTYATGPLAAVGAGGTRRIAAEQEYCDQYCDLSGAARLHRPARRTARGPRGARSADRITHDTYGMTDVH